MKKVNYRSIDPMESAPGVGKVSAGVRMRRIFGEEEGASFTMRVVEHDPTGLLPHGLHSHSWEHQFFIVSGRGVFLTEEGSTELGPGDCVFVAKAEPHTIGPAAGTEPFFFVDCVSKVGK